MDRKIELARLQKEYIACLIGALEKNKRYADRISTYTERTKRAMGEQGGRLYKQAFDQDYPRLLVEVPIIERQLGLLGRLLKDYTVDSVGEVTQEDLVEKYGKWTEKVWSGNIRSYKNSLLEFLSAFVAFLQESIKEDRNNFARLRGLVPYPKD